MKSTTVRVKPIPEGYHTLTPFLIASDAGGLIEFLKKGFHAQLTYLLETEEGLIRHAELKIGDSVIMVSSGSQSYQPMPCMLQVYVEDCDRVYEQALQAGAAAITEPANQFYGDRAGAVKDKWGNQWWIATHIEDVSDEEIKRRESSLHHS